MYFVYNEPTPRTPRKNSTPYENLNAPKHWLEHYENSKYLTFIRNHNETTFEEKRQAEKELLIAERKLTWWRRHPNWQFYKIEARKKEIDKMWSTYKPVITKQLSVPKPKQP